VVLDQSWADVKLSRTLEVPAGADVRFWVWNNYTIEELWDYGFIEVSTDGGSTWTQLEVRDEAGNLVSTDEDPNGRLRDYGGLENGLTGTTGGQWRHDWVDLTPYAGTTIGLRLRYATDAAFEEPGWFADDFEVTADGTSVWSDDVESGADGWTSEQGTFTDTEGAGWIITNGTFVYQHHYLAEWRNYDGFDKGLRYAYDTTYFNQGREWRVTRTPYNAPGMLVWYRDAQYTVNHVTVPIFEPPSTGSKGQLLIVDSHFDPLRRFGEAAEHDPTTLRTCRRGPSPPTRPSPSGRPARSASASRTRRGRTRSTATGTPRCLASPASPTPRAGTRGWSCAARTCSSATWTPRWWSPPRTSGATPPGSSTPTGTR
jgi:immune inhibitor A